MWIKVFEGQTLVDIALQEYGNPAAVVLLAELNGLELTADLVPGQELEVDESQRALYYLPVPVAPLPKAAPAEKELVAHAGQSLLDIALQEYGDIMAVFPLVTDNGLDITQDLLPGQKLTIKRANILNPAVAGYYSRLAYKVNTDNTIASDVPALGLIDWDARDWDTRDWN